MSPKDQQPVGFNELVELLTLRGSLPSGNKRHNQKRRYMSSMPENSLKTGINKFTALKIKLAPAVNMQKKMLISSIYPVGVKRSENGYSKSEVSPYWSGILGIEDEGVKYG